MTNVVAGAGLSSSVAVAIKLFMKRTGIVNHPVARDRGPGQAPALRSCPLPGTDIEKLSLIGTLGMHDGSAARDHIESVSRR